MAKRDRPDSSDTCAICPTCDGTGTVTPSEGFPIPQTCSVCDDDGRVERDGDESVERVDVTDQRDVLAAELIERETIIDVAVMGPLVIALGRDYDRDMIFSGAAQDCGYRVGMVFPDSRHVLYVPETWRRTYLDAEER